MDEFKKVALEAVKAAEERILFHFNQELVAEQKADFSPVTKADKEAEEIIVSTIKKRFPNHGFSGEEFGTDNPNAEFVWYIDPIDGTKEFIHGIETFGTILGLKHGDQIILGVVNLPALKELIFASTQEQTTINAARVGVSKTDDLSKAYINFGGYRVLENQGYMQALINLKNRAQSVKGFPYAYSFSLLVKGKIDGMIDPAALPHDVSAWTIIVKQAGGKYSDFYGNEDTLGPTSLATNGKIHSQLMEILK